MRRGALGLGIGLALALGAGCKLAKEPPPGSELLGKARDLAARMCACTARPCAEPLLEAWNDLRHQLAGVTFTEEQVEGLANEDQRFVRCMDAIAGPR
jgi:hypothetical protein